MIQTPLFFFESLSLSLLVEANPSLSVFSFIHTNTIFSLFSSNLLSLPFDFLGLLPPSLLLTVPNTPSPFLVLELLNTTFGLNIKELCFAVYFLAELRILELLVWLLLSSELFSSRVDCSMVPSWFWVWLFELFKCLAFLSLHFSESFAHELLHCCCSIIVAESELYRFLLSFFYDVV